MVTAVAAEYFFQCAKLFVQGGVVECSAGAALVVSSSTSQELAIALKRPGLPLAMASTEMLLSDRSRARSVVRRAHIVNDKICNVAVFLENNLDGTLQPDKRQRQPAQA